MKKWISIFLLTFFFIPSWSRDDRLSAERDSLLQAAEKMRETGKRLELLEREHAGKIPKPPKRTDRRHSIRIDNRFEDREDSLVRIDIQLGALDSLLKNLPIPEKIEINGSRIRVLQDSLRRMKPHRSYKPTERKDIVKFGEDVIVGRNEVVEGDVVVIDGDATIYGYVEGGVVVVKGNIRLASTSRVDGDLVCVWGNTDVDPGASAGSTNVFNFNKTFGKIFGHRPHSISFLLLIAPLIRTLLLLGAVALIGAAFAERTRRVRRVLEKSYAKCLAVGLISVFLLPFVFVVLIITILGIPIALLLLPLAVLCAFLLGVTAFGFLAGEWLLDRFHINHPSLVLSAILGVALFVLPSYLCKPFSLFDSPFSILCLMLGIVLFLIVWTPAFGAVVLTRFGRAPKTSAKQS